MKDLVVLVADNDMKLVLDGLLSRSESIGIRAVEFDIFIEPEHDPACALRGVDFLEHLVTQYQYAILIFDHEGSGKESVARNSLQVDLNRKFALSSWGSRGRVIVLEPELEAWLWSDSPHVDDVVGWKDRNPKLRPWLIQRGWLKQSNTKPERPKEAFEAVLREVRKPRSASLYKRMAEKVSLQRCVDIAFVELCSLLREWFPQG